MQPCVGSEFGVEAGADDFVLLNSDDFAFVFGEDLNIGADLSDDRGADKDSFEG